ncbi:MAG: SUMF1/EgtB/PvdO family nonheme iron enzyme [Proteobacteria bacterium]|nr:SUMF1/EgtB/PvdO family nonheme iron enzyme [Pseudomonadota bacterium]
MLFYEERKIRSRQNWLSFPVSGVSGKQVELYLAWLRQTRGVRGAELCTEEQWERAARGADARMFPHGNALSANEANYDKTYGRVPRAFGPDQVGSHPHSASPFGIYDMVGNIGEMTRPIATSPGGVVAAVSDPDASQKRLVVRGGSFFHPAIDGRVYNSWSITPDQSLPYVGFRVCASVPPNAGDR